MLSRIRSLARRFLVLTIAAVGVLCGAVAVLFERYVHLARELLIGRALEIDEPWRTVAVVLTPAIMFVLIAATVRRLAPRAVGANLARVRMAYNNDPALVGKRSVAATFLATPLSLGAGAPLGPEGPIVVVTSGISSAIARALRLPRKLVRGFIPVGVAAGISAVFNTPITGVVFALEEVFGSADRGLLGGVLVGAVAAAVVQKVLLGGTPLLAAPPSTWTDPRELVGFALLGLIAGAVSGLAILASHRLKRTWAAKMPSMTLRAGLAGLMVGAAGLVAPPILGVGYGPVSAWLHGGGTAESTALAFVVKTIAFVIAISAGVLGGSFAPSLFIGTALGSSVGHAANLIFPSARVDPSAYAIVGMGTVFAGMLRCPIAAVLIVIELTRDYELILPLMLGVSLAVAVSRRISRLSIVEQQMVDEGWVEGADSADPLAHVTVSAAMSRDPIRVSADMRVTEALQLIGAARHKVYPVIDRDGRLAGLLPSSLIAEAVRSASMSQEIRELMETPQLVVSTHDDLISVVRRMQLSGVDRCPVVDEGGRLSGFLSPSDILRARISSSRDADDTGRFELFQ